MKNLPTLEYLSKQIDKISFFNKLSTPTRDEYITIKMGDRLFTHRQYQKEYRLLDSKYRSMSSFIQQKVARRFISLIESEIIDFAESLSELELTKYNLMFPETPIIPGNRFEIKETYNRIFDNVQRFNHYTDATVGTFIGALRDLEYNNIPKVLSLFDVEDVRKSIVDLSYAFRSKPAHFGYVLRLIKMEELKSFYKDTKLLTEIIQLDRKYSLPIASKNQIREFTRFFLKDEDHRLNTGKVVRYLLDELDRSTPDDYHMIKELIFKFHYSFSGVIAGKVTKESYGDDLYYFRRLLTDGDFEYFMSDVLFIGDTSIRFSRD